MNTLNLNTIDAYNKLYGLTTSHPLVTVIDLKKATKRFDRLRMNYGVYARSEERRVGKECPT